MVDGVERVGVLAFHTAKLDAGRWEGFSSVASLVTLTLLDKDAYSDHFGRLQRVTPMRLPAELVWAFLPPRTVGNDLVTSSAVLEPAYDLGGDSFEHSLLDGKLQATVLDAMGHDLSAGITSAVAMAAFRHARHNEYDLPSTVAAIDSTVHEVFPERYTTGLLAQLEMTTGHLIWANCGHPTQLLLRGDELVPHAFERETEPPLRLGRDVVDVRRQVHRAQLEPGDREVLYTDGVIDARNPAGEHFGEASFIDFLLRAIAAGETSPEMLRRLVHTILGYRGAHLI